MHLAVNGYFWDRPNSGTGQYTRQLVRHLLQMVSDLQVTLVYPRFQESSVPDDLLGAIDLRPVPTRRGHLAKVYFEQFQFPRLCRAVGADIAHVPYWGGPLKSPIPLVVTVHDITTHLVREYRRSFWARTYNALVSASTRGADHVITDSLSSKNDIAGHLSVPEQRISVIHLAAGSNFTSQPELVVDMAIHRKYNLPDSYILYLGGYEVHKNVTTLLLAYTYAAEALGADYPLVLAGKKPARSTATFPDYDAYIRQLGIEDQVRWIGLVEEGDKPAVYRGASCFVFLSRHEGFGLPPLEAMACGVPVVASDCTSLPEVVGDAAFTLDPDDEKQIGGSIIATVVQPDLANEMKQKGLAQAARFSWEKTATETLMVYDRLREST